MSGIILVGILSGMIFGALAMLLRRAAAPIILLPILLAPILYLFVWRDAIMGHCLFASTFGTPACSPTRDFFAFTLAHASDAILVLMAHLGTAVVTVVLLSAFRSGLDRLWHIAAQARRAKTRQALESSQA